MAALQGSLFRFLAGLMTALLILFQTGCATQPHSPSLDLHLKLQTQRIALVPARFQLAEDLELFARSRLAGIGKGVGEGIASSFMELGNFNCQGEYCGAVLLIVIPIALVVGGTVGGVMGAIQATPEEEAERMEQTIHEALEHFSVHMDLSKKVLSEANSIDGLTMELVPGIGPAEAQEVPDYQRLATEGFDSVLEICVCQIEFGEGKGKDPELALHVVVDARLVDVGTGAEAYAQDFHFVSSPRRFSEWAAEGAETIERKFDEVLEKLAKDIVNNLFVVSELPGSSKYGCCWLCPHDPPNDYSFFKMRLCYPSVDSLQPSLEWDAFPDAGQARKIKKETGATVSNVSYDLRIWDVSGEEEPGALVYECTGLVEPSHTLERALAPKARYFWSFRACFQIAEGCACTPWAFSTVPSSGISTCENPIIPFQNYYRFQTPDLTAP